MPERRLTCTTWASTHTSVMRAMYPSILVDSSARGHGFSGVVSRASRAGSWTVAGLARWASARWEAMLGEGCVVTGSLCHVSEAFPFAGALLLTRELGGGERADLCVVGGDLPGTGQVGGQ